MKMRDLPMNIGTDRHGFGFRIKMILKIRPLILNRQEK